MTICMNWMFSLPKVSLKDMMILHMDLFEDKICMGTECEENKPSNSNKEDNQVSGKDTVPSTTSDTN